MGKRMFAIYILEKELITGMYNEPLQIRKD
jgi:hypothetical protein